MAKARPAKEVKFSLPEEKHPPGFLERLLYGPRRLGPVQLVLLFGAVLAVGLGLYHLFVAVFGPPEGRSFRSVHLTVMLVLAIMMFPLGRASATSPLDSARSSLGFAVDLAIVAAVLFVQVWTLWDITAFHLRYGDKELPDLVVGGILIACIFEATRRAVGWSMVLITLFFVVHALYANHFFGFFYGPPVSYGKFIDTLFMSSDGIFGIPLYVCATFITLFIIFGALLIRTNAGRFFIELAVALTGHRTGGPAKAAAVASGFMGTVSGSAVANVVTTGTFTIPLMARVGYRPKFAAAVEACASSGGQITPPIMGAAAFIIAEFLGVPYTTVIIAAIIPALLYFATIYFMVHLEAEKEGVGSLSKANLPGVGEVLGRGWYLMLALVVLVAMLLMGYTPMRSAFFGIVTLIALSFVRAHTRLTPVDILAALESGIRSTVPVTIACACAGLIIGSVFVSGLGLKFTQSVIEISGGNLLLLLALTGVAAIILGMGITTTAVYITVAALIVPAVIKVGVEPIAAHMFAFYFGVVSTITPPVALGSFAAAAIARTPPMATAVESTRIGVAKYLAPLIFVYNPSLLFVGPIWLTLVSTALALSGLWVLSLSMEGWYRGRLAAPQRAALGLGAVGLLIPPNIAVFGIEGYVLCCAGLALSAALVAARHMRTREYGA